MSKKNGVPNGIRTRVAAVKGRCPRPLDDGNAPVSFEIVWLLQGWGAGIRRIAIFWITEVGAVVSGDDVLGFTRSIRSAGYGGDGTGSSGATRLAPGYRH